jgi:hypothetical protein
VVVALIAGAGCAEPVEHSSENQSKGS